ncbi:SAV_2336 N-terminal domain-related protein [Streptomyces pathocidini]|uniref:SAV_2336 N-terminal domain-related protein n=2 Tax=Streptomyces pathocidini TaxID=1650571 RepID=A0ABW7USW1_9ACTN
MAPSSRTAGSAAQDDGAVGAVALAALVARLREAGLPPTSEELADAVWLARWTGPPGGEPVHARVAEAPDGRPAQPAPAAAPDTERVPEPRSAPPRFGPAPPRQAELFAPEPGGGRGEAADGGAAFPVRVPAASALPDPQALQRALRPLQRFRAPLRPARRVLDERATADRAADTGLVVPVLRGVRRREARVQLLMDVSTSMAVWDQTLDELRQVCERAGAFREVRVHYVYEAEDGSPAIGTGLSRGGAGGGRGLAGAGLLQSPARLCDPTGRQLTLLLSDCAGPMWRGGRMQRLLHRWSATAPVAVVQPLPQRMWRRTHLPAVPGVLRRCEGPAGRLEFRPARGTAPLGTAPVPVLAPTPAALGTWARLVSGTAGLSLNAAAGWAGSRDDSAGAAGSATGPVAGSVAGSATGSASGAEAGSGALSGDTRARVQAFRRTASPEAAQLAVHLSAVPLVLPVMQLVQRAMLAGTGPSVLAEVLLSGLLRRADRPEGAGGDERWYAFVAGVREELMRQLAVGDAQLVLKHCSQYVERHFGRRARNFPAMAAAYLAGSVDLAAAAGQGEADDPGLRPFARVSERVLRRFLPEGAVPMTASGPRPAEPGALAARARTFVDRFRAEGTARDLDEGIRLFQAASEAERRAEERALHQGELAEALFLRWETRHVAEDLRLARVAAERAAGRSGRVLLALGRILTALAEAERDEAEAFNLLVAAEARLADVFEREEEPETERDVPYAAGLLHVDVLRRMAVVDRDVVRSRFDDELYDDWYAAAMNSALSAASTAMERVADVEQRTRLLVTWGRLHLDLARYFGGTGGTPRDARRYDFRRARGHARDAGVAFQAGMRAMSGTQEGSELARVLLARGEARELGAVDGLDDAARAEVLADLGRALELADPRDSDLRVRLLRRRAEVIWTYRPRGDGSDGLELARRSLREAADLVERDDPRHAKLLVFLGELALAAEQAPDAEDAVRLLREALSETSESHHALPQRRLLFGRALHARFLRTGSLADLHEADWILGAAARAADAPGIAAQAWQLRGEVALALAAQTGSRERRQRAAADFRHAAEAWEERGDLLAAARARLRRGTVLESTAGPAHAVAEYRRALALLDAEEREQTTGHGQAFRPGDATRAGAGAAEAARAADTVEAAGLADPDSAGLAAPDPVGLAAPDPAEVARRSPQARADAGAGDGAGAAEATRAADAAEAAGPGDPDPAGPADPGPAEDARGSTQALAEAIQARIDAVQAGDA